jgi:hypothetical protein
MIFALAMIAVTVQPGNTMSGIAASHHLSLSAVEAANPQVSNPNYILAGQSLNLPSGNYQTPNTATDHDGDSDDSQTASPSPSDTAGAYPVHHATVHHVRSQPQPASVPATTASGIPAWATCIVQRESGGNPSAVNSVPGYVGDGGGLFGDLTATWGGYGGYAQPFQAPVSVQIQFNNALSGNGTNLQPWAADECPGT